MSLHDRRRSRAVLAAETILLVAAVAACNGAPTAARPGAAPRARNQAAGSKEVPLTDVKLELLQRAPATLGESNRNPFRFEARSEPTSSPPTLAPRDVAPEVGPRQQAVGPTGPTGPASVPPIPLRFIGFVEAPGQAGRVAIMSDGRGNVFYGREGDTIEGRYKMLKVGPEVVELTYIDGRGRQTIRLSGQ